MGAAELHNRNIPKARKLGTWTWDVVGWYDQIYMWMFMHVHGYCRIKWRSHRVSNSHQSSRLVRVWCINVCVFFQPKGIWSSCTINKHDETWWNMMKHDETWGYWPTIRSIRSWSSQIHPVIPNLCFPKRQNVRTRLQKTHGVVIGFDEIDLCFVGEPVLSGQFTCTQRKSGCHPATKKDSGVTHEDLPKCQNYEGHHVRPGSSFPRKALARSGERTSENAPPQGSWAAWDATQNQLHVSHLYTVIQMKSCDKPSQNHHFHGLFKVKVYHSLPHEYERCTKLGPPIGTNQAAECRQLEQRTKSHCAPVAEDCQCCETHLTTKTNQNMDIMCCKVWENQIVHVGVSLYNIV